MKKKNLIFFLPDFVCGGAGKSITSLCKNLDKNKFQISIICLNKCYYKSELKSFCNIYEIYKSKALFAQSEIKKIIKKKCFSKQGKYFHIKFILCKRFNSIISKKILKS